MASTSEKTTTPSSPRGGLEKGPFDCVKKLNHDQVTKGWREGFSSSEKRPYYYNIFTRQSVWYIPNIQPKQQEESQADSGPAPDMLAAAMSELSGNPPVDFSQPPFIKGKPAKKRKFSPDPYHVENERNAVRFHIGGERYVYVERFKKRVYVNIQEYFYNESKTELLAGKKGLNLTGEEWWRLIERRQAIADAMDIV